MNDGKKEGRKGGKKEERQDVRYRELGKKKENSNWGNLGHTKLP